MKYAIVCLAASVSMLGLPAAAQAQSASGSYTYIEGAYQGVTLSRGFTSLGEDIDGDGGRAEASLAITKNIYVIGSYEKADLDDISAAVPLGNFKTWGAGIGFNTGVSQGRTTGNFRGLTDKFTLFADGWVLQTKTGLVANESYNDGFLLRAGFRAINYTPFEFIASGGYEKREGLDGEFVLEGRLLYEVVKNLQIQAGVEWNDNVSSFFLGLRYNIPRFSVF